MAAALLAFKAWWAKSRWAIWAVIGLLVVIMLAVVKSLFDVKPKPGQPPGLPPVPQVLQDKVNKADEDNLRIRIESKVVTDEHKKQLEETMKIDDGAERRKRLAEMLQGLK